MESVSGLTTSGRTELPALALGWLAADFRPRLIVSADLQVLWSNDCAQRQLAEDHGVTVRDGALQFASTTIQWEFVDFIEQLDPQLKTFAVRCNDPSMHLLFRGRRVEVAGGSAACLEFTRDSTKFLAQYQDIERVFALTPAEHRVAIGLLNGRTAVQLAGDLLISVDTVRTHVRRIYSKIGVRSREELFARLRPFRIL